MIFSSSILQLNALAMWTPKTTFNEELVLSRLIAFAFSHGLGQQQSRQAYGVLGQDRSRSRSGQLAARRPQSTFARR